MAPFRSRRKWSRDNILSLEDMMIPKESDTVKIYKLKRNRFLKGDSRVAGQKFKDYIFNSSISVVAPVEHLLNIEFMPVDMY